jgi:translation initiation factor IF-1
MSKDDYITVAGTVIEVCPNSLFRVQLENGITILAHLAGKLRINNINVHHLDQVTVEISSYDLSKGRIVYRQKRPPRSANS